MWITYGLGCIFFLHLLLLFFFFFSFSFFFTTLYKCGGHTKTGHGVITTATESQNYFSSLTWPLNKCAISFVFKTLIMQFKVILNCQVAPICSLGSHQQRSGIRIGPTAWVFCRWLSSLSSWLLYQNTNGYLHVSLQGTTNLISKTQVNQSPSFKFSKYTVTLSSRSQLLQLCIRFRKPIFSSIKHMICLLSQSGQNSY